MLSREELKMLKGVSTAKLAKDKKRKVDEEVNHEKEIVSSKDIEKLHKRPKTDKATRLANVMVDEANDDTLNINFLPDEVILEIFSYLKQNQLGQIARVCRRWNVLSRSPVLWKTVNVKISPSYRSPTAVTKAAINRLPSCVNSIRFDFAYRCERLDFVELCERLQEMCPHLEKLIFTYSNFSCSFPSFIDLCTQYMHALKKLAFYNCAFPNCRPVGECGGISKIESLDVFYCFSYYAHPLNNPPFSRMPYLKRLQLYGSDIEESWFKDDTSFLSQLHVLNLGCVAITSVSFPVIQNHGLNLKELCLREVRLQDHDFNFNNSVFPQLVTICLVDCKNVTCEDVVSLLHSCQSLQNIYVNQDVAESFAVHPFVVTNRCRSGIVKRNRCNHADEIMCYLKGLCTYCE